MTTIERRLWNLEHELGVAAAQTFVLILENAGQDLEPGDEAYIRALDEQGRLPAGFNVVNLPSSSEHPAKRDTPRPQIVIELVE
jgi:hypothetical protein